MIGVASFAVASLLCGLAQSPAELVGARLLQGLTGAVMVPQVLALITATFPARERSRALAWFGVTMGLAFVSGQILGGLLLQANVLGLGWRAIFLVNVPVGAAALIAAALVVPHARGHRRPRLDPLGAAGRLGVGRAGAGAADPGPRRGLARLDLGLPGGLRCRSSRSRWPGSGG